MLNHQIFDGAIPKLLMSQIISAVDFSDWKAVYVGCSGTFSFERAIGEKYPKLPIYGNDVSLMSCVMASIIRGEAIRFAFKNRLAGWEERLIGRPYQDRCADELLARSPARPRSTSTRCPSPTPTISGGSTSRTTFPSRPAR
jgi:hypothetical protein